MKANVLAALVASLLVAGCATPFATQQQAQEAATDRAGASIREFASQPRTLGVVREISGPTSAFKRTDSIRIRGDVNVNAAAAPFGPILSEIARKEGYSVAFGDGVDILRKVSVNFTDAASEEAIRTTAFLAGYAAVIDKERRTVMVAEVATYSFRLPSGVFSALQATYSVGGNPANSTASSGGGSAGGGGGGGSSSGGTSLRAEFTVNGTEGNKNLSLQKYLTDLAGRNAEVIVSETGVISVRANAQALRRVHDFMRSFARDAMTQVEMEASVVEVALSNEFEMGIQWNRVLSSASKGFSLGGNGALGAAMTGGNAALAIDQAMAGAASNTLGGYRVSANSASIINALSLYTDVHIVSQPKLVSMNNTPATFFDGAQLPYVPMTSQSSSGSGSSTTTTVTGQVAFAIDGVSFSAIPSVVDDKSVQITLIPVLSSVTGYKRFLDGQLEAPLQSNKQTYMRVLAETGKTLILGGIRYSVDNKDTSIGASTGRRASAKEIVILLRAHVVAPPDFDPIVSESL